MVLDTQGKVWTYGLNYNGQLGLGHNLSVNTPTKVPSLNNIISIKSEGDISFALANTGKAYMWPVTIKGEHLYNPIAIPLNSEKVTALSCGGNFVIIATTSGNVYSFGKTNNYGQLGHGDLEPKFKPTLIEYFSLSDLRITQVSCGYKHVVVKTSTGYSYTWGLVNFNLFKSNILYREAVVS